MSKSKSIKSSTQNMVSGPSKSLQRRLAIQKKIVEPKKQNLDLREDESDQSNRRMIGGGQPVGDLMQPKLFAPKRDPWKGWKKRICICVPTTGLVRVEWMMSRFGQVIPVNWSNGDIFQFFDQFSPMGWAVADARNICVEYFISQKFEWLFFIDHDVVLPPDTFLKINEYMRKAKYPVVCGLYYCKGTHPEPLLFRGRGTSYFDKWKKGDKVMVDGIPMGCTLIHGSLIQYLYDRSEVYTCKTLAGPVVVRRVFETPREAWFDPETSKYNTRVGTEDLFWCDRLIKEKVFENCGDPRWKKFQKMKNPFLVDTTMFCKHIDEAGRMYP